MWMGCQKLQNTGDFILCSSDDVFQLKNVDWKHIVTCYATGNTVQIVNWFIYSLTLIPL
jgi:hypothetical protein